MKNNFKYLAVLSFAGFTFAAHAEDMGVGKHHMPCMHIREACEKAGFAKGEAAQGKGLWKDCVGPIAHGQTVAGVTVAGLDKDQMDRCAKMMDHHMEHHMGAGKMKGGAPNGGAPAGGTTGN